MHCWRRKSVLTRVLMWGVLGVLFSNAKAQTALEPAADEPDVTTIDVAQRQEQIEQRLASLEASTLPEGELRKVNEFYQQALSTLGKLEEQRTAHEKFVKDGENYPQELAEVKKLLAELPSEPAVVEANAKLEDLEATLNTLETDVRTTRDALAKSEAKPKIRTARLAELPKLTLEAQQQLDETLARLESLPALDATNLVAIAERSALESNRDYLVQYIEAMEAQRKYILMSSELVQQRRDYQAKVLALKEEELSAVRTFVQQRRKQDAQQQAVAAKQAAQVERPEAIAALAEQNSQLAEEQAEIVASIGKINQELTEVNDQLERVDTQFTRSQQRIEASGMSESIGLQLRQQQELLPDVRSLRRHISQHAKQKATAVYKLYELHDTRSTVVDVDLDQRVSEVLEQLPAKDRESSGDEVRKLLESERTILDSIIENYQKYSNQLTALTAAESKLISDTREYANFIAKNVLWIRSCRWPSWSDWEPAAGALRWSLDPQLWRESGKALWQRVLKSPPVSIAFFTAMSGLIYLQERLRRSLREIGVKAEKRSCIDFSLSLQAAGITLLLALPWPALFWFAGWWLAGTANVSAFTHVLSLGLQFTAVCLLLLELVRHVCRSKGLAESHFTWPKACVTQVRRNLRVMYMIGLPLVFWLTGLENQDEQQLWSSSLGRLWYVVVMLLSGAMLAQLLLVKSSAFRQTLLQRTQLSKWRLSTVWIPLVVAAPILLAVLAIVGYYYTAQQLALRMLQVVGLMFVLTVLGGLTRRWILLNRRRLAREQARQKRAAALAAAEASGDQPPAPITETSSEEAVDLYALGQQTNRLVQTLLVAVGLVGAWLIWGEMLPALSLVGEQAIPGFALKWGELIRFLLVIVVTYFAIGNVPALLEFAVLQHLPLDAGLRYAITSLCRYVLVAMGIYLAYTSLGFDSTSIQWLVAAMGVGLGFGLQEIFANFVSGVILLFERPIRVGDIVTLGDKTGQVSRIRMRATTIVDWDRKEYLVPNKDLVTERLLNWTLSDQTNRIVILVGVAYGSDTDRACRLLVEAATEHPLIVADPSPSAVFDGFGDSTLNLTLRCFLPNLDKRLDTIHDLHSAIDRKFKAAEIEIAFPQLDLHVKGSAAESGQWVVGSGQNGN